LNRITFKSSLAVRYGKKVTERMILFLDTHFGILLRSPFDHYVKMLKEFVKAGPVMWRKFAFFCLNIAGNEKLCEHDMFAILEQFRLRDYIYFYRELHSKERISSHYREAIDETD
jgi:hypothetical protein